LGESSTGVARHDTNTHAFSDKACHQPNQEKAFAVFACITTVEAMLPTGWLNSESHICVTVWEWNQQASENFVSGVGRAGALGAGAPPYFQLHLPT